MGMTNQITSDGILRTWKWNDNNKSKVIMTVQRIELTPARVAELQKIEERVEEVDRHLRRDIADRYAAMTSHLRR